MRSSDYKLKDIVFGSLGENWKWAKMAIKIPSAKIKAAKNLIAKNNKKAKRIDRDAYIQIKNLNKNKIISDVERQALEDEINEKADTAMDKLGRKNVGLESKKAILRRAKRLRLLGAGVTLVTKAAVLALPYLAIGTVKLVKWGIKKVNQKQSAYPHIRAPRRTPITSKTNNRKPVKSTPITIVNGKQVELPEAGTKENNEELGYKEALRLIAEDFHKQTEKQAAEFKKTMDKVTLDANNAYKGYVGTLNDLYGLVCDNITPEQKELIESRYNQDISKIDNLRILIKLGLAEVINTAKEEATKGAAEKGPEDKSQSSEKAGEMPATETATTSETPEVKGTEQQEKAPIPTPTEASQGEQTPSTKLKKGLQEQKEIALAAQQAVQQDPFKKFKSQTNRNYGKFRREETALAPQVEAEPASQVEVVLPTKSR